MFDIKAKVNEIVEKAKKDPKFMEKLQADPVKTVEGLAGVDLPDDAVNGVVEGVKAKLAGDKLGGMLNKVLGK